MHNLHRLKRFYWDGRRWSLDRGDPRKRVGTIIWLSRFGCWWVSQRALGSREFTSFSRAVAFAQGAK